MPKESDLSNRRKWRLLGGGVAAVAFVVGGLALVADGDGGEPPQAASVDESSGEVIEGYLSAYNSGDVDAMMSFFDQNSVIIDHPFSPRSEGLEEIRLLMMSDVSEAAETDAYAISNLEAAGGTVTWDHRWTNRRSTEFCGSGHRATILNGKIATWTWPTPVGCP